jgi:polysaccharide export outer membrane protein
MILHAPGNSIRHACLAVFIGLAAALMGCSSGPQATIRLEDAIAQTSVGQQEAKEFNDRLLTMVGPAPQPQDYVISEGDLLQVTVFEAEELKREVRVGDRGAILLPLLGAVQVKGLTTREAAQKVEEAYRRKYLQDPHVDIFVKEYQGGKITLLGALNKPGTINYFGRQRLLDVLALGEGLTDKAGRTVQVRRSGDDPRRPTTYLIDLDEIVVAGNAELNVPIQRGDVIYVPDMGRVFVDGAVKKPGNYGVRPAMTVQEAIVEAGGFSTTADESKIKVVRKMPQGKREVIEVNINDLRAGAAPDLQVKDRDLIFVETNKIEALIYGLRLNFFTGLVGVGYTPPPQ